MNARVFSYRVDNVTLEAQDDALKLSPVFDRKALLEGLKERFLAENYTIDEASVSYKLIDDQLYIQGVVVEKQEKEEVGFRFGKK